MASSKSRWRARRAQGFAQAKIRPPGECRRPRRLAKTTAWRVCWVKRRPSRLMTKAFWSARPRFQQRSTHGPNWSFLRLIVTHNVRKPSGLPWRVLRLLHVVISCTTNHCWCRCRCGSCCCCRRRRGEATCECLHVLEPVVRGMLAANATFKYMRCCGCCGCGPLHHGVPPWRIHLQYGGLWVMLPMLCIDISLRLRGSVAAVTPFVH